MSLSERLLIGLRKWSKHEACFARATLVWLAVNHNTHVTSGE